MDCKSLSGFVGAYVDGELVDGEKAEADAHLSGCATCRRLVHDEASFRAHVRSAAPLSAPFGLRDRIVARLAVEPIAGPRQRWVLVTASAGAMVVALVSIGAWWVLREQQLLLTEEAALRHARALPLEIVGDDIREIRGWLSGKVDFNATFPVFAGVAPLLGARLSHLRNRQAAYLAYRAGHDGRLSLFVFDDPDWQPEGDARSLSSGREVHVATSHGFQVVSWKRAGIAYSLVSDLDEREILALIERAEER